MWENNLLIHYDKYNGSAARTLYVIIQNYEHEVQKDNIGLKTLTGLRTVTGTPIYVNKCLKDTQFACDQNQRSVATRAI